MKKKHRNMSLIEKLLTKTWTLEILSKVFQLDLRFYIFSHDERLN